MSLVLPKITYYPLRVLVASTLNFIRQPKNVAAFNRVAARHDNIATAGPKEAISERVDNFLEFDMPWTGIGADVNAWDAFMFNAAQGIQFSYFPDATLGAFTNYTLEGKIWNPGYKKPGLYSFRVRFRQVVV